MDTGIEMMYVRRAFHLTIGAFLSVLDCDLNSFQLNRYVAHEQRYTTFAFILYLKNLSCTDIMIIIESFASFIIKKTMLYIRVSMLFSSIVDKYSR